MVDQPPRQALPPENQPWRRWVEASILSISKRLEDKFGADVANAFRGTASSLGLLSQQVTTLKEQQETLATQQEMLAEQQAYQASLVTLAAETATFNSGDIPIASGTTWLSTGPSLAMSITINVPTGALLLNYGCSEISVQTGNSSAQGLMSFDFNDNAPVTTGTTRVFAASGWIGSGTSRQKKVAVTPGLVTVRARFGVFTGSTTPGSTGNVNFREPWMSAQVIPA